MTDTNNISRLALLEHVALPMGNLSQTIEGLLSDSADLNQAAVRDGLRAAQLNAEAIYQFILKNSQKPTSRVGMRTPEVLREFVTQHCASLS